MFGIKERRIWTNTEMADEIEKRVRDVLENILGTRIRGGDELIQELKDLVGPKVEIPKLKKQLAELKLERDIEERDIKHLVKMKEEKLAVEHQKSELTLKNEYKDKEMALQTEYHDKVLKQLEVGRADLKEVYANIMRCLPNVNMQMRTGNPDPPEKAE